MASTDFLVCARVYPRKCGTMLFYRSDILDTSNEGRKYFLAKNNSFVVIISRLMIVVLSPFYYFTAFGTHDVRIEGIRNVVISIRDHFGRKMVLLRCVTCGLDLASVLPEKAVFYHATALDDAANGSETDSAKSDEQDHALMDIDEFFPIEEKDHLVSTEIAINENVSQNVEYAGSSFVESGSANENTFGVLVPSAQNESENSIADILREAIENSDISACENIFEAQSVSEESGNVNASGNMAHNENVQNSLLADEAVEYVSEELLNLLSAEEVEEFLRGMDKFE